MTLDQIDELLASWTSDLETIRTTLDELESSVAFREAKQRQLVGTTKDKTAEAFLTIERIWLYREKIKAVVETAIEKRRALPLLFYSSGLAVVEELLTGDSIVLEQTAVPAGDRELFGGALRVSKTTPVKLKEVMQTLFPKARDVFTQLRTRWGLLLDKFVVYRDKIAAMRLVVDNSGKPVPAELTDCEVRLAAVDRKRRLDPLAITVDEVERELESFVRQATLKVDLIKREGELLGEAVGLARKRLEDMQFSFGQATNAYHRGVQRFDGKLDKPTPIAQLVEALETVARAVAEKRYTAADTGLLRWKDDADRIEASYKALETAGKALQEQFERIQARLTAAVQEVAANPDLCDDKVLKRFKVKADEVAAATVVDLNALDTHVLSYETRLGEQKAAIAHRPPATAKELLERRLKLAHQKADTDGFANAKPLVAYADKARTALAVDDLVTAESMIFSYETKVAELEAAPHQPGADQPQPKVDAPKTPKTESPTHATRKEELEKRLANVLKRAGTLGLAEHKVLTQYATKARTHLDAGNLDGADGMVFSYETKLGELTASKPTASTGATTTPTATVPVPSRKEQLVARLAQLRQKAKSAHFESQKSLNSFASAAEAALQTNDLDTAQQMLDSFDVRLQELVLQSA